MAQILIIEDESSIAENLKYALETEHFQCAIATTGGEGIQLSRKSSFDLIVLDIGLPDVSGFDVCKTIRNQADTPILFLSARNTEVDRILGLEFGADDFVTKPFSPRELTARIRAILRRSAPERRARANRCNSQLIFHDPNAMQIFCCGRPLNLTAHEYKLMSCLLAQPNRTFTRDQLLEKAWQDPGSAMDRTIDAHVKTLRAKLRQISPKYGELIQTRRGLGYAYNPQISDESN